MHLRKFFRAWYEVEIMFIGSVVQVPTSYHVKKSKNGNDWLFLCDIWSLYLEKLRFMHTKTHEILNLESQDVSKEILSIAQKSDEDISSRFWIIEIFH